METNAFRYFLTGSAGVAVPTHPFTHHEILELIAPFTRAGRHVDLEASDRLQRRLQFKPISHPDDDAAPAGMIEILRLESVGPDSYRLNRALSLPCGLTATVRTEGSDPGVLLARIAAMQPQRQFRTVAGIVIALDYGLESTVPARPNATTEIHAVLTRGEALIEDIRLVLNAATVKGYPAEFELTDKDGDDVDLPEDLLAVIGWGWGPLRRNGKGWRSNLRVSGAEPARSRQIELKLEKAVAHLAGTLAAPPLAFHDRLLRARWKVVFRRGIPLLIFGGMIAGAGALTFVEIPQDSIMNLVMMGTPPLLLFGAFGINDRPPLEIPPLPRRLKTTAWRKPQPAPAEAVTELPPPHTASKISPGDQATQDLACVGQEMPSLKEV